MVNTGHAQWNVPTRPIFSSARHNQTAKYSAVRKEVETSDTGGSLASISDESSPLSLHSACMSGQYGTGLGWSEKINKVLERLENGLRTVVQKRC